MPALADDVLETIDLVDVEILATGGPVHGVGSPPEGDFWSTDQLEGIAAAGRELADELKAPNKLSHSKRQELLRSSGLTEAELPRIGWIDGSTLRLNDAGTRMLGTIRDVPRRVARLIEAGAYATRSAELSRVTSQTSQKTYDYVLTGLSWLGGKLPAVRTLADVEKLYQAEGLELELELRTVVLYEVGALVWDPTRSVEALKSRIMDALNPGASSSFWVSDLAGDVALVQSYDDPGGAQEAFVVGYTVADDGSVSVSPSSDWTPAVQAWVEASRDYAAKIPRRPSDTPARMPLELSAEQETKIAEKLGVPVADLSADRLLEALESPEPPPPADPPPADPPPAEPESDEKTRALESRLESVEGELKLEKRRDFVETTLRERSYPPGDRAKLETLFDKDPDTARAFADALPKRTAEELREYGDDRVDDDADPDTGDGARSYADDASGRLGIPKDQVI